MLMAANQRKKRLSSNSIAGISSRELHRTKKKSLATLQFESSMKPHISLELDVSQMQVIAKKEQIGLSRRDLAPNSACVSYDNNTLADVITLPKEIFHMECLESVFSYEVWRQYLSEDERILLLQFLPNGVDTEEVVQSLFEGSNFSFGNPVLNWTNMLASGNLHPDVIIQRDQSLVANQRAFCSKLQDYHNNMLRNLLQLKEMWDGCQDPVEFLPHISRTNNPTVNCAFVSTGEFKLPNPDHNFRELSESVSSMEYDQACSSDDHTVIEAIGGELQESGMICRRGLQLDNTMVPLLTGGDNLKDSVTHRKGDNLRNNNIINDTAKYMAYIRITKKQVELLKSMMQHEKGIQPKSVKQVLGNLSGYSVQPVAMFEEEERSKLREQWLLVVNTVAQASAEWRLTRAQKIHKAQLLYQDLKENVSQVLQDDESTEHEQTDLKCCDRTDPNSPMYDDDDSVAALPKVHDMLHYNTDVGDFKSCDLDMVSSVENVGIDSVENDGTLTKNLILCGREESMFDMAPENDEISNSIRATYTHSPSDFLCSSNPSFGTLSRVDTHSAGGFWQSAKLSLPSNQATLARRFINDASKVPSSDLQYSLDPHSRYLSSDSELLDCGPEPGVPYSLINQGIPSAYQNEDSNGSLLQSVFNSPELPSYKPRQKLPSLHSQQTQTVLMRNMRLPVELQGSPQQSHSLEARLKIDEPYYLNQHYTNNMHDLSGGSNGFSFPVQQQLPSFQLQECHANSVSMGVPLDVQSHAGNFSSMNWYSPPGQQIHGGWSNPLNEASLMTQCIGNRTSNNDESLFSVLSQCKEMRSSNSYDRHIDSMGPDIALGASGVTGGNISRNSNVIPQIAHPLDFYRGTDVAPLPHSSIGWVNIPQQTSNLPDPMGKTFLRPWNQ